MQDKENAADVASNLFLGGVFCGRFDSLWKLGSIDGGQCAV